MVEPRATSRLTWILPLVLVAGVVSAVLLLGTDTGTGDGTGGSSSRSTGPAALPSPTTRTSPEAFCTAFRTFADAQSLAVAAPDDATAEQALVTTAEDLLGLGQPLGLSPGGFVSLQQLVLGALPQTGAPAVEPGPVPPDPAALDAYLSASCPA